MTAGAVTALRGAAVERAKTPTRELRDLLVRRQKLRPKWSRNPSDTRIERYELIAPLSAEESRALAQALEPLPPRD